ncbi:ATP-binding cassette domain-containing protein [Myxacorys almedinensis A]|uniref:ABC-type quaternary amine transporter n=2 Tax=Myxacorys TaxID=2056239 RepID=A0A8J8CH85_9CYAN|nr:ATP-binding cassette domain-containing protein [Myxacorys almedinensis A]
MTQREVMVVEFCQVHYSFKHRPLLFDLSFTIHRGETLMLLGRSGCGKTTLLRLINHLLTPTAGEIRVEGVSTQQWNPIHLRRRIGYVIQEVGLFPHFTIEQNIGIVPRLEKWNPTRIRSRVYELLDLVGLDPDRFARRYPHELSGGQRQRVGVARALAADPPLLLMDEPFGALDPITRVELQREFKHLQQQLGKTVVFVTHDTREAVTLGSRIGLMQAGRLVELATPELFERSQHPEAQAFLNTQK